MKPWIAFTLLAAIALSACVGTTASPVPATDKPSSLAAGQRLQVTEEAYFTPSMRFDAIRPVYQPSFFSAEQAPIAEDELIIGVELDGQAKAYPLKVLRFREMVNDELAGLPILVTF